MLCHISPTNVDVPFTAVDPAMATTVGTDAADEDDTADEANTDVRVDSGADIMSDIVVGVAIDTAVEAFGLEPPLCFGQAAIAAGTASMAIIVLLVFIFTTNQRMPGWNGTE
ncbi:hypothetical protein NUW58_g9011 [Xylaria curta]|uniref:Uncharacterized protein n=1 Tax=Xylaria curta TaxID=42375 RepID=A0ACC1N1M9_9PEZI|nr:hypothetical protein NUW58_g9011 [Xylaria curta]